MKYLARMNPLRAVRDLRLFLHQRQKHELIFLFLSIFMTGTILIVFAKDSEIERVYDPKIIYVEQWRLDRTDAEIHAQQAIDGPLKQKRLDEERARREKRQEDFKKVDDKLKSWGI